MVDPKPASQIPKNYPEEFEMASGEYAELCEEAIAW